MTLDPETLCEITRTVWSALFEVELVERGAEGVVRAPAYTGVVRIDGAYRGAVAVTASEAMVRRAAARMFDRTEEAVSEDEVLDAIGELANMCGGNAKALLPGPSTLSLPEVGKSKAPIEFFAGAREVTRVVLEDGSERIVVTALSLS